MATANASKAAYNLNIDSHIVVDYFGHMLNGFFFLN